MDVDEKILLEYYRLKKDYEGSIILEGSKGIAPESGGTGTAPKKKNPFTVIIEKINQKHGTNFTEIDKVLMQVANDYASQDIWEQYAKNNDSETFQLLFAKDFPQMAVQRYEQNEDFFVRLFHDPEMMRDIIEQLGPVLYILLRGGSV